MHVSLYSLWLFYITWNELWPRKEVIFITFDHNLMSLQIPTLYCYTLEYSTNSNILFPHNFYFIGLTFITLLFTAIVIARFLHSWGSHIRNTHIIMDSYINFCTWTFCPSPPSSTLLPPGSGVGHIFHRWLYINWNYLYKQYKWFAHISEHKLFWGTAHLVMLRTSQGCQG